MFSPYRIILAFTVIVWLAIGAHVDARRILPTIVFKKGSGDLGEVVSARKLLQFTTKTSVPDYREADELRKFTGTGVFDLRIDPVTGETTGVRILKSTGHSELDASALKALINWRFKPGTLVRAVFPMTFTNRRNDWPESRGAVWDRGVRRRPY